MAKAKSKTKSKGKAPTKENTKAKGKAAAKAKGKGKGKTSEKKPRKEPAGVNRYGIRLGTSRAVAIEMLEKGASMSAIKEATGTNHYNLIDKLAAEGHLVEHADSVYQLTHKDDAGGRKSNLKAKGKKGKSDETAEKPKKGKTSAKAKGKVAAKAKGKEKTKTKTEKVTKRTKEKATKSSRGARRGSK